MVLARKLELVQGEGEQEVESAVRRYEVWSDDWLHLMLDTTAQHYSAEWYTETTVEEFFDLFSGFSPLSREVDSLAMLSTDPPKTIETSLEQLLQEADFPEKCNFLKVTEENHVIGWAEGPPKPSVVLTVHSEDTEALEYFYMQTAGRSNRSEEKIESTINQAKSRISNDVSTSSS